MFIRSDVYEHPNWLDLLKQANPGYRKRSIFTQEARHIYFYLCHRANKSKNNETFVSEDLMVRDTAISKRRIVKSLKDLEKLGLLKIKKQLSTKNRTQNVYRLTPIEEYAVLTRDKKKTVIKNTSLIKKHPLIKNNRYSFNSSSQLKEGSTDLKNTDNRDFNKMSVKEVQDLIRKLSFEERMELFINRPDVDFSRFILAEEYGNSLEAVDELNDIHQANSQQRKRINHQ